MLAGKANLFSSGECEDLMLVGLMQLRQKTSDYLVFSGKINICYCIILHYLFQIKFMIKIPIAGDKCFLKALEPNENVITWIDILLSFALLYKASSFCRTLSKTAELFPPLIEGI